MIRPPPRSPLFPYPPLFRSLGDAPAIGHRELAEQPLLRDVAPVLLRQEERNTERPAPRHDRHLVYRVDTGDRKSTRLNSSHLVISYAVFCLKKKKTHQPRAA